MDFTTLFNTCRRVNKISGIAKSTREETKKKKLEQYVKGIS
ncbi:unnamed protein product [Tenebrio molitor]|nr:unnamed protein product [Tenebrio molitor]